MQNFLSRRGGIFFLMLFLPLRTVLLAQTPVFSAHTYEGDIGWVYQDSAARQYQIFFYHSSPKAFQIDTLHNNCRCFSIEVPQQTWMPNSLSRFLLNMSFHDHIGSFSHLFTFVSTKKDSLHFLISGNVIPSAENAKTSFLEQTGPLRWLKNAVSFGNTAAYQHKTQSFFLYNQGKDTLSLRPVQMATSLSFSQQKWTLLPKKIAALSLRYHPQYSRSLGYQFYEILLQYEAKNDENTQNTQGYVKLYASTTHPKQQIPAKKEPVSSPQLHLSEAMYNLGKISKDIPSLLFFTLYNAGEDTLRVQARYSFSHRLIPREEEIAMGPKQQAHLSFFLAAPQKKENMEESVDLLSNDAKMPSKTLRVKASFY